MGIFDSIGLVILMCYVGLLMFIARLTGNTNSNSAFFTSDRNAPWAIVAIGMIGASLSGVTFISIPGEVGSSNFYYFQIVMGYMVGYAIIAFVLIPLYYKIGLVSIYEYLKFRFGIMTQISGSSLFIISQALGASLRLLIVALVLQTVVFKPLGIPFYISVACILFLIWLYTRKGGIKTIVYTDVLQTVFILAALLATLAYILNYLNLNFQEAVEMIHQHPQGRIFDWELKSRSYFFKHFFSGILIALVMTGLDQNMMQKSLACKSALEAKKNVFLFSLALLLTNLLFLILGFFLFRYAELNEVTLFDMEGKMVFDSDKIYGLLAIEHAPYYIGVLFLLGVVAASFSSADSSLTSLTTTIYHDFYRNVKKKSNNTFLRKAIHILVTLVVYLVVICFTLRAIAL